MRRVVSLLALIVCPALSTAQEAVDQGYPNVNRSVEIAPGESVQLLNRVLVERAPGVRSIRRMDFQYRTSIPAADAAARSEQAQRAAKYFGAIASEAGARMFAVAICDSDACARRESPPREWYIFEMRGGSWKPVKN